MATEVPRGLFHAAADASPDWCMIVQGYTVPAEVEARLVERMREGSFTLTEL